MEDGRFVEYPVELKKVCQELTLERMKTDSNGFLRAPEGKGLGVSLNPEVIRRYLKQLRIEFEGTTLNRSWLPKQGLAV